MERHWTVSHVLLVLMSVTSIELLLWQTTLIECTPYWETTVEKYQICKHFCCQFVTLQSCYWVLFIYCVMQPSAGTTFEYPRLLSQSFPNSFYFDILRRSPENVSKRIFNKIILTEVMETSPIVLSVSKIPRRVTLLNFVCFSLSPRHLITLLANLLLVDKERKDQPRTQQLTGRGKSR